ncbi:2Fe-2S iron-sulfur cluster-binding protein [Zhongshania aliphaticivorans]|uniref:2Fe-2S iron-sulfur cluster-binding protein n=1 Tax=Zhongshania aliphaticivorans TaxID=1470434 RepID=UPI0012E6CDD8|nr:2Fe-2S iron-sulfur cluster binding domain-containing protein [Zhongshania aliphaticivorans]CAA0083632.1 Xylene monooxygenase electron transfer component [Zhongshania aliphaticivorans]
MSIFSFLKPSPKTVTIEPAGISFEVKPGQSILEAGLAHGYAMPHSCTVGTCGSCKCKLTSGGKVRELTDFAYVLEAEELQDNMILTCQSALKLDVTVHIPNFELKQLHPPEDYDGEIIATEDLTHDVKKVTLRLDRPMWFDAGQYVQLHIDEFFGGRSYSFALPPSEEGLREVDLFIRHVPGGEFTGLLFEGKLDQTKLKVHGPSGNFWLRDGRGPIICVGGGSGLAPIVSLLEQAAKAPHGRPCVMFFGARTQADLYCLDRIAKIGEAWDGAFQFVPVLSDEPENSDWTGLRGFVNTAIESAAGQYLSADTQVYLCGPPPMIDAVTETVLSLGVDEKNVHADKFLDASHGISRQN